MKGDPMMCLPCFIVDFESVTPKGIETKAHLYDEHQLYSLYMPVGLGEQLSRNHLVTSFGVGTHN
jgi:hypothetical protein